MLTLLLAWGVFSIHTWTVTETLIASAISGALAAILLEVLWQLVCAPADLDRKRRDHITRMGTEIQDLQEKAQPPMRTPVDEYHHKMVAAAIKTLGEPAKIALRHLRHQGAVTVTADRMSGNVDCSSLPPGIDCRSFGTILSQLVNERVVKRTAGLNTPQQSQSVFDIAQAFIVAIDELLYTESKS